MNDIEFNQDEINDRMVKTLIAIVEGWRISPGDKLYIATQLLLELHNKEAGYIISKEEFHPQLINLFNSCAPERDYVWKSAI